jgi:hypothetical protein
MNKIVREHYPVERLPEDLRRDLEGSTSVRLTLEVGSTSASRSRDVLERARQMREAGLIKPTTEGEAVERIRRLRDE